ncbi:MULTISPECIES: MCE family protein [Rhodococcus]|uniref:Phospholipid/cholesterol/gamma-HCH transport system substrate-binding protein n=1 Tax=Rhodococcus koreensis TaxID=99653 RepID=A0A1H4II67_9NOCA|nr:MCE family protein [Rhodococcus koreensis]SEB33781.1 phospholipid/cholesterol/gamma-HCH transport system substrate-binding protein [Rhodococcus koreensis]
MGTRNKSHYKQPPLRVAGAAMLVGVITALVLCMQTFRGAFEETVPLTVVADRSGLVMEPGAKVQLNGVEIGRVKEVQQVAGTSRLSLDIDSARFDLLSADTTAEIKATTAFGAKYVALTSAGQDSSPLAAGSEVRSGNVTTEINTVFENLTSVMHHVDPAKLNSALGAVAEGLRGRGEQLGDTMVKADSVLVRLNPALPQLQSDLRDTSTVVNTYADVAPTLMDLLKFASTTSDSVVEREDQLDATLTAAVNFGNDGAALTNDLERGLVDSMRLLLPTTGLLSKYSPEITCLLQQSVDARNAQMHAFGGNTGYSADLDVGFLPGDDPYRYPENLPKVEASGGPGGQPGCYPMITKDMYPAPVLVTDTGASIADSTTPRLGSPFFVDYLFGNIVGGPAR